MDGKAIVDFNVQGNPILKLSPEDYHKLIGAIDAAIAQARAEERERIAKMVEDVLEYGREQLAAAIRRTP